MRAFASLLAVSLALAAPADAAPRRVASLNLCTDELVLLLAAPEQVASVTHLSHQPAESPLWRQARRHSANDGTLLSVAPLRPDLVVTMGGGARDRLRISERLGIRTLDLPYLDSLDALEAAIGEMAGALGREAAGRRLSAELRQLRRSAPPAQADAIWLGGGGRSVAAGAIGAEWMALAGLAQRPLPGDRVSLEQLLVRPPEVLLRSDYRQGQYSGEQRWLSHPLARRARAERVIRTDGRPWTCMGPNLIPEIRRLRRVLTR